MSGLREALEKTLTAGLPVMRYEANEYPTEALPKAQLLDLLALHSDDGVALPVRGTAGGSIPAATPSSPLASRERVAEVLREFGHPTEHDGWVLFADELDDFHNALLAAGVFRSLPTQVELTEWLREIFTADPGGTPFGTAAEELLRLLSGDES